VALDTQNEGNSERRPWQDRRVIEVMHPAPLSISSTTSLAAAAQLLVERGINCLPVVEYIEAEKGEQSSEVSRGTKAVLVGLLTRSDLLMTMARTMGAFQPGIELHLPLPDGDTTPLARMLMLANDLHIHISSVIAGPMEGTVPTRAIVRIGTIHPAPLLSHLREVGIEYSFEGTPSEGNKP
ncbi:MAG TPA: CBS domain-containing protein, partial [Ktedonobacteraceae bacterium]|nr:CBS domain-containing protein [Ktedonobacteraceae bacterium]